MRSQKSRLALSKRVTIAGEERLEVRGLIYRRVTAEKTSETRQSWEILDWERGVGGEARRR
jgi:hypothetical protein